MATRKTTTKRSKRSKKVSLFDRLMATKYAMPAVFIIAFAIIGGVATLFLTRAATSGSAFVGIAGKCLDNASNTKANGNKIQLWECNGTPAQKWTVNGNGTITNANGYCLDARSAGKVKGTIVQLYTCNSTVAQRWTLNTNNSIVNPNSGLCLDVKSANTANGTQIQLWECNGTPAQKWTPQTATTPSAGENKGSIVGLAGKCLDNAGNKKVNLNKIQLYNCNGTPAQKWTVNGNGTITNANGYCLDETDGSKTPGTLVVLYVCDQTPAQQWKIVGGNTIVSVASNLCLDVKGANTANGTQIQAWTCNGTAGQKWTVNGSTGGDTGGGSGGGGSTGGGSGGGTSDSGTAAPKGDIAGWKQIFVDDFTGTVPLGAFSDCNHNVDTPQAYCGGLKNYGSYYTNWWAYPNTWPDTAKSGADGNTGAPFGGTYHPEDVVSVSNGAMHIAMFRPTSGGDNHVATMVPRACMDRQYGRYTERFRVVTGGKGFKSAHLFYQNGYEIDFPESDDYTQTINAFTHPSEENFSTNAKWSDWHTTTIEWTSSSIKYYIDGKLIGTATRNVPRFKMSWALQNESSIAGPYAAPGDKAQLDIDWVSCYAPV